MENYLNKFQPGDLLIYIEHPDVHLEVVAYCSITEKYTVRVAYNEFDESVYFHRTILELNCLPRSKMLIALHKAMYDK